MIVLFSALALAEPLDCAALTPLVEANVPATTVARTLADSETPLTPELLSCIEAAGADAAYLATLSGELDAGAQPEAAAPVTEAAQARTEMPTGRVEDGWPYVWLAYGITWLTLVGYTLSLLQRMRKVGESS